MEGFKFGDKVSLDGEVEGTVDGFYVPSEGRTLVVVNFGYKKGIRGEFVNSGGKSAFVSMVLCHPSNLERVEK